VALALPQLHNAGRGSSTLTHQAPGNGKSSSAIVLANCYGAIAVAPFDCRTEKEPSELFGYLEAAVVRGSARSVHR
jgi:hypothetical protein